jgi:Fe-S cluster biosynthesis and repair protein YggX
VTKGQERKVCKLKRSIYGLKQASRQWNGKFHQAILKDGLTMMEEDHCVYLKRSNNNFIILSLYIDDILIAENNKEMIDTIKKWLSSNFEMKDMGEASYVLGVKIIRDRAKRLLGLSQETYIKKMLDRYHMQDSKPMDTLVDKSLSLSCNMCPKTLEEKEKMSKVPYASVVGSLIYTMMCTRPDICYVIGLVSRYQSNPGQKHLMVVKMILRYLKGASNYMLCYQEKKDLRLIDFSDADWGGDVDQSKSTSGCAFLLNDSAILWRSKKQSYIA